MKIKKIVIVGGGSSGWMTAAALAHIFPKLDISLVEGHQGALGVGESTLLKFNQYLNLLDLKDKDWMKECKATYKGSIAFTNFREGKGERFQYPFGEGVKYKDAHLFHCLRHIYPDFYPPEETARFFNRQTLLVEQNRISDIIETEGLEFDLDKDTAYHLDAGLFGQFLKNTFGIPNGVNHYIDNIVDFEKDKNGNLCCLHTKKGNKLTADLFIDCTGFKSLLLEEYMGSKFIPFNDFLFNDTTLATRIPYIDKEKQMKPWTDCIALKNGWVFESPVWDRIGTGYTFSQKYTTIEKAEEEFREHLKIWYNKKISKDAEIRVINIKHGKREKAWVKNVVGIGLSHGFIEPLESTGLLTVHDNILKLVNILKERDGLITQRNLDEFNFYADGNISRMMVFVAQHYYFTSRRDTKYWEDCTFNTSFYSQIPSDFIASIKNEHFLFLEGTEHLEYWNHSSSGPGLFYIATGNGYNPYTYSRFKGTSNEVEFLEFLEKMHLTWQSAKENTIEELNKYPSHYQYLKEKIYK